jgi:hypothetical protein
MVLFGYLEIPRKRRNTKQQLFGCSTLGTRLAFVSVLCWHFLGSSSVGIMAVGRNSLTRHILYERLARDPVAEHSTIIAAVKNVCTQWGCHTHRGRRRRRRRKQKLSNNIVVVLPICIYLYIGWVGGVLKYIKCKFNPWPFWLKPLPGIFALAFKKKLLYCSLR